MDYKKKKINKKFHSSKQENNTQKNSSKVISNKLIHKIKKNNTTTSTVFHFINKAKKFLNEISKVDEPQKLNFRYFFRFTLFLICLFSLIFFITFSLLIQSKKNVLVPNLVNKNVLDAMNRLEEDRLKVRVSSIYSKDYKKYTVISQKPHAGIEVKENREIKLTISMGKNVGIMPNFIGKDISKTQANIIKLFASNENIPGIMIKKIYSDEIEENKIIDQSPLVNSPLNPTTKIVFIVSNGKIGKGITIKDYVGKYYQNITREIENAGIHIKIIPYETTDKNSIGQIFKQNPEPNTYLKKDSTLELTVGIESGNAQTSMDSIITPSFETFFIPQVIRYNNKWVKTKSKYKNAQYSLIELYIKDSLGKRLVFKSVRKRGTKLIIPYMNYGRGELTILLDKNIVHRKKINA